MILKTADDAPTPATKWERQFCTVLVKYSAGLARCARCNADGSLGEMYISLGMLKNVIQPGDVLEYTRGPRGECIAINFFTKQEYTHLMNGDVLS